MSLLRLWEGQGIRRTVSHRSRGPLDPNVSLQWGHASDGVSPWLLLEDQAPPPASRERAGAAACFSLSAARMAQPPACPSGLASMVDTVRISALAALSRLAHVVEVREGRPAMWVPICAPASWVGPLPWGLTAGFSSARLPSSTPGPLGKQSCSQDGDDVGNDDLQRCPQLSDSTFQ